MPKQPVTKLGAGVNCRKALPIISPSNQTEKGKSNGMRKTFLSPNKARQRKPYTTNAPHQKKCICALRQYLNFKEQRLTLFSTLKTLVVKHKHRFPLWRKFQIVKLQNNGVAGKCTLVTAKTGNKKLKCKRLLSKCMLHGWTLLQGKYEKKHNAKISLR